MSHEDLLSYSSSSSTSTIKSETINKNNNNNGNINNRSNSRLSNNNSNNNSRAQSRLSNASNDKSKNNSVMSVKSRSNSQMSNVSKAKSTSNLSTLSETVRSNDDDEDEENVDEYKVSGLTKEEKNAILGVLARNEEMWKKEKERIRLVHREMMELRAHGLQNYSLDANLMCSRCQCYFGWFHNKGVTCVNCQQKVCVRCRELLPNKQFLCSLCSRIMDLEKRAGEWFYKGKRSKDEVDVAETLLQLKNSLLDKSLLDEMSQTKTMATASFCVATSTAQNSEFEVFGEENGERREYCFEEKENIPKDLNREPSIEVVKFTKATTSVVLVVTTTPPITPTSTSTLLFTSHPITFTHSTQPSIHEADSFESTNAPTLVQTSSTYTQVFTSTVPITTCSANTSQTQAHSTNSSESISISSISQTSETETKITPIVSSTSAFTKTTTSFTSVPTLSPASPTFSTSSSSSSTNSTDPVRLKVSALLAKYGRQDGSETYTYSSLNNHAYSDSYMNTYTNDTFNSTSSQPKATSINVNNNNNNNCFSHVLDDKNIFKNDDTEYFIKNSSMCVATKSINSNDKQEWHEGEKSFEEISSVGEFQKMLKNLDQPSSQNNIMDSMEDNPLDRFLKNEVILRQSSHDDEFNNEDHENNNTLSWLVDNNNDFEWDDAARDDEVYNQSTSFNQSGLTNNDVTNLDPITDGSLKHLKSVISDLLNDKNPSNQDLERKERNDDENEDDDDEDDDDDDEDEEKTYNVTSQRKRSLSIISEHTEPEDDEDEDDDEDEYSDEEEDDDDEEKNELDCNNKSYQDLLQEFNKNNVAKKSIADEAFNGKSEINHNIIDNRQTKDKSSNATKNQLELCNKNKELKEPKTINKINSSGSCESNSKIDLSINEEDDEVFKNEKET